MGEDKLKRSLIPGPSPGGAGCGTLVAEEGASLSSGSLRLYYMPPSPPGEGPGAKPPIGALDLYAFDPLNRRCAVGIMVATEHRRQGHALAMLAELHRLAREVYHLHQLYADIAASNTASLDLFRKSGYFECGRFREWLAIKDSTYADSIRMQKLLS